MKNKVSFIKLFLRLFFIQALWNFEGLQNAGFLFVIFPALKKIYPDKEKRKEILLRHIDFFNTQPYMAGLIVGLVAKLEEDNNEGRPVSGEEINSVKKNMAGPLAAMGDAFFWGSFRPLAAIIATALIFLALKTPLGISPILAPVFFVVFYNVVNIPFRYWGIVVSYKMSAKIIGKVASINFQRIVNVLRIISALILLAVMIFYVVSYSQSISRALIFVLVLGFTILWSCIRWPITALFYLTIIAGLFLSRTFQ